MLSAGLASRFSIRGSEGQTGYVVQLFEAFTGFVISTKVLPSKLDRFPGTIDVLWEKIATLIEFS